jgi:TolA-binding protein
LAQADPVFVATDDEEGMTIGSIGVCRATFLAAGLLLLAGANAARAQVPVSADPAEITACLCQQQGVAALSSDMSGKTQALAAIRQQLADLDSRLARARSNVDVNNPDSVARYKALLEERDAAYRRSTGPVVANADQATSRYNALVNEYNGHCANRMFDSVMMAQIQAHLSCPPLQ